MKLPLLDQLVPLERGDAFTAASAIGRHLQESLTRPAALRLWWQYALCLTPLEQLRRRLLRRHQAEALAGVKPGKRAKPKLLRVPYAELVALRECQGSIQSLFPDDLELVTVLCKFQQRSTALDQYIKFSS